MRPWRDRALTVALAVCLIFCNSMYIFAAESANMGSQAKVEYSQWNAEESQTEISDEWTEPELWEPPLPPEWELSEIQTEELAELETALPRDLSKLEQDEVWEEARRICETMDEFIAELEKDIGGVIGLSGDGPFVVEDNRDILVTQPVTVQLPPKGIEIAEYTEMYIAGPVTFTGTIGFSVNYGSHLYLYDGVQIHVEQSEDVASIAVSLFGEGWQFDTDASVTICALGDDAIAIFSQLDTVLSLGYGRVCAIGSRAQTFFGMRGLTVEKGFIDVQGDHAFAIRSEGLAELLLVSVNGIVEADEVYAVLSTFSHPPENLIDAPTVPNNTAGRTVVYENLLCGSPPVAFYDEGIFQYWYRLPYMWRDSHTDVECTITWNLDGLDYSSSGEYTVTGTVRPIMDTLPDFTVAHEITVMPTNRAAICYSGNWGEYAWAECLSSIQGAEKILFWIYQEGDGWRELTKNAQAIYSAEHSLFELFGLETDQYYWAAVEVVGGPMAGFSNIWLIEFDDELGGDRTGTDRQGTKPTTLPPASNPDSKLPEDGETGGESSSGNSGSSESGDESSIDGNDLLENKIEPNVRGLLENTGVSNIITSSTDIPENVESESNDTPRDDSENVLQNGNILDGNIGITSSEPDNVSISNGFIDVSDMKTEKKDIPVFESLSVAASTQVLPTHSEPKVMETPPAEHEEEKETLGVEIEQPLKADVPLPYDWEQSAPEPKFPVNAVMVFFLSIAALGVGILLVLGFCGKVRWQNEKP